MLNNLLCHLGYDLLILLHQVIPSHTGLTRKAGGDYDNIGVARISIIIGADDQRIIAEYWPGLKHIQSLPLRHIRHNIIHHDIGIVALGQSLHQRTTDKASTHYGYFTAHYNILSLAS